jgi:hypothetical protein
VLRIIRIHRSELVSISAVMTTFFPLVRLRDAGWRTPSPWSRRQGSSEDARHVSAAMTLDVYFRIFDDDLTAWRSVWTPRASPMFEWSWAAVVGHRVAG